MIAVCAAQTQQLSAIPLWPNGAPGANLNGGEEIVRIYEPTGDHLAELYLKLKKLNIPVELHIYANAGHGFGIRKGDTGPSSRWPEVLVAWLHDIK
ncbi:MAG: hypothetical protein A2080_07060 [Ignavibacteria bacterium GWC2_36_12]|nr:MAG: hypothetical protein A2080_07060 [Ignavibacteria bacterium GWC2_36_12]